MNKKALLFTAACMGTCLIPSIGTLFAPTTVSTENRTMAAAPRLLTEAHRLNTAFFDEFEDWFTEHMALRNQLVSLDARIQTTLFDVSNVEGVIKGKNGWLYYSSTLSDYEGTDLLSDRERNNIAHNIAVVQDYLTDKDIAFVFTIPPNKNTLYGENMPYYDSVIVNEEHNAVLLASDLDTANVHYLNLFELLEEASCETDEPLYLKQDSHWNEKGACLAYNALMDSLDITHEDYADQDVTEECRTQGDLSRMLYSFYGKPEADYSYDLPVNYLYEDSNASVEDGWIVSNCESGSGTLLMFRDSFANKLIPFLSNEFETACYSKGQPHTLESYIEQFDPDYVIMEKVERNVSEYLDAPPILSAPEFSPSEDSDSISLTFADTTPEVIECPYSMDYIQISGQIKDPVGITTEIIVDVNGVNYRAYQTGENGYLLYLKKDLVGTEEPTINVFLKE